MYKNKQPEWEQAISCAISNSINYHPLPPRLSPDASSKLEKCITRFLCDTYSLSIDEAQAIYSKLLQDALNKRCPDGTIPAWMYVGSSLGMVVGGMCVFIFLSAWFSWVFLFLSIPCFSLGFNCSNQIRQNKKVEKMAAEWIIKSGTLDYENVQKVLQMMIAIE